MDTSKSSFYRERVALYTERLSVLRNQHKGMSILRLLVILIFVLSLFWLVRVNLAIGVGVCSFLAIAFLFLIKKHLKIELEIAFTTQLLQINTNELGCCEGNYSHFGAGDEFVDVNHPYSYDIDLFGEGSMFQYLNRTSTRFGSRKLFEWLAHIPFKAHRILMVQESVKELTPLIEFRQHLQAIGGEYKAEQNEEALIEEWVNLPSFFKKRWLGTLAIWGLPIISMVILTFTILGILPMGSIVGLIVVNSALIGFKMKQFNKSYSLLNQSHGNLKKVQRVLALIHHQKFESEWLNQLQQRLQTQNLWADEQINQLTSIINKLDYRNNFIVALVLNTLFFWDWQYILKAERWKAKHSMAYSQWTEVIGEFEALSSLANFAFNNPKTHYPNPVEAEFPLIDALDLGHPLIPVDRRVGNNIFLNGSPQIAIITGANMAGKSTFLRAIAINLVLAGCGAPVCAGKLRFTPLPLFTSMRTEDSIQKNESYFFAELKRLQRITREIESDAQQIIILDEILRGTNSDDKRTGSIGFIKKITRHNAFGLVATHDLELARLATDSPEKFIPLCFEVSLQQNQLQFDYKLKNGITQNMNATFLMKQMGIIDFTSPLNPN